MPNSGEMFSKPVPPKDYVVIHTDGGARGNPGPAGYGVVITDPSGKKIAELSEYLGHQTNNFAEYSGLLAGLEYAVKNSLPGVKVVSDSELMVKQLRGEYKVRNPQLQELHAKAKRLISQLPWFEIRHALRENNADADRLANEAMDKGSGRRTTTPPKPAPVKPATPEPVISGIFHGVVRNGKIELLDGSLPEGTRVLIRKS